jgi:thymidylate synthase
MELDNKNEKQYLKVLQEILDNGDFRDDRTGVGTISVFGKQLRFDISESIPLITTRYVGIKSIIKELIFFLSGKTNTKILEEQDVKIWSGNTSREFLDNRGLTHYKEGDMGPMYGISLCNYNCEYKGCDIDYTGQGYNQLENLIKGLKEDPMSRRHLLTTFNPTVVDQCVLYPCHGIVIQFYVKEKNNNKYLSCHTYNRSQDYALGVPYNIMTYTILTYIIAKKCDMMPDELIISTGDTHVYKNHIENMKELLTREPFPSPLLELNDEIRDKEFKDIMIDDFKLINYKYHPSIKMKMAI